VVALAFLIALAQHPELDHAIHTISKLSARGVHDAWTMSIGFAIYGLLIVGYAWALRAVTTPRQDPARGALAAHGALMLCAAVFRDDTVQWGWTTVIGAAHDISGGMAFSALLAAMVLSAWASRTRWHTRVGLVFAGVFLASGVLFLATPHWVPGYTERAFALVGIAWVQWTTISTLPGQRDRAEPIQ
jgi:hypothetical protein